MRGFRPRTDGLTRRAMANFFISHSTTNDREAACVVDAVRQRITERGHRAFADSDIPPGHPWRAALNHELARCDAAVVLLNKNALESTWVKREVNMLLWRHYLGSTVRLRVVLLGDVTVRDVSQAGFGELRELQFILPTRQGLTPEEIAAAAIDDFGRFTPCEDPMRMWVNRIVDLIKKVEPGDTLNQFARALGVPDDELDQLILEERHRFLAHQLLGRADREGAYYAVAHVRHLIGGDATACLARYVAPALVDGEAASRLLRGSARRAALGSVPHRGVFALNAEASVTGTLYVRRATCCEIGFRHAEVTAVTGEDLVPELVTYCRQAVLKMLNVRGSWKDARVQRWLRMNPAGEFERFKGGFLVINPAGAPMAAVADAVTRIRADFPWLTIILLTGARVPDDDILGSLGLGDVLVLRPELREDEEFELGRTLDAFRELIKEEIVDYA